MAKKKLKMTKKCIAARRRYRAKKAGGPRKRRGAGGIRRPTGKRRGRGGRGRGRGAGFWGDFGQTLTTVGKTVLPLLPMLL